jgi:hypothetical protein
LRPPPGLGQTRKPGAPDRWANSRSPPPGGGPAPAGSKRGFEGPLRSDLLGLLAFFTNV